MKRRRKNRTNNSTIKGSQATDRPFSLPSGSYTSERVAVPNLVAEEEEGEEEGSNSTLSSFSSLSSRSSLSGSSKFPRVDVEMEEEEERMTLLKNTKFLEIIGVSLDNNTIPTKTFDLEREKNKMKSVIPFASPPNWHGELPMNLDYSFERIHYIWGKMTSCEIDPKTSEIMKKAVDLAYTTNDAKFISRYLNKSLIEASEKILEGERKELENTSICEAVIECFCTSLLETAKDFLEYYSTKQKDPLLTNPKLKGLDKIKQLNCFVRFYDENNREWVERPMILEAYSEYWKGKFQSEGSLGVDAWDNMSVEERIKHFKAFGMGFYQENEEESCYSIIEDELIKLLDEIVQDKQRDIFEKTGEEIRDKGFFGGKKTKNKSKRKSTNKKKSKRKSTNKKKSRKSRKSKK